jgi:hypothetical protein
MHFFPKRLKSILLLYLVILAGLLVSGCQAGGMPGSRLLTPIGQAPVNTATNEPSLLPGPKETLAPSPSLEVTLLAEMTATPEPSLTATLAPTITQTIIDDSTPTFGPSPTRTRTPTRTPFPSRTPIASRTPTITLTSTPPSAWMRLQRPGMYSKVVSPIKIEALISPGDDGYVYVELTGEDGRMVTRQTLDFRAYLNRHFYIAPEIPFEIKAASEIARLVVRVEDRFQRPINICSVDLVLMHLGKNEIYPQPIPQEPYLVRSPRSGSIIQGGVLQINGLARMVNDQPIQFDLIDAQGQIVGSTDLDLSQPYGDLSHIPFNVYIPYAVEEPSDVRLVIYQQSNTRIPGIVWLSSLLLMLEP